MSRPRIPLRRPRRPAAPGADRGPLLRPVRDRNPVVVGAVGLVLLLLLVVVAYRSDDLPFTGGSTGYSAHFTEAAGLRTGDEVRVAGAKVGKVTAVALDGDRVRVGFRVHDTWVGDASTVSIGIRTFLGEKYLALVPLGAARQDPSRTIPTARTTSPYDVTQALEGLGKTVGAIDTEKLAESFRTVSETFADTPGSVRGAAEGLSALSRTIASRDAELARLLEGSRKLTRTLSDQNGRIQSLVDDGDLLLGEVERRRDAVHRLLTGTRDLSTQLSGLVADNQRQLAPTLDALDRVTTVLRANQDGLDRTLALLGPYYRLMGNTLGNGRWFDSYLCGVVPKEYLPEGTTPTDGCMPSGARGGQ
ncbi:MCE family protein [Kitasatospora sp. NBC_01539]|uniref:MCE family protein n=1 Tax=Kitasatospora sp. NBC_01539 TaxID=2903577 RepID=UPI0038601D6A